MTSKQKRKIARENGAKAAGTKSPEGLKKSSMNALRHGFLGDTVVLCNESKPQFQILQQSYIEKFQPQDDVEMDLVSQMVSAQWRLQRNWVMQKVAIDLEMQRQQAEVELPQGITEPGRATLAFSYLANAENSMALLQRYETSLLRMQVRAEKQLFYLREQMKLQNEPKPHEPEPQSMPEPAPKLAPTQTSQEKSPCSRPSNEPACPQAAKFNPQPAAKPNLFHQEPS